MMRHLFLAALCVSVMTQNAFAGEICNALMSGIDGAPGWREQVARLLGNSKPKEKQAKLPQSDAYGKGSVHLFYAEGKDPIRVDISFTHYIEQAGRRQSPLSPEEITSYRQRLRDKATALGLTAVDPSKGMVSGPPARDAGDNDFFSASSAVTSRVSVLGPQEAIDAFVRAIEDGTL